MLRLTISTEEYLLVDDNIKIVFLGGTQNHLRIMVDAPKDVNIVRSSVLESKITDPQERAKMPKYYAIPESPERYRPVKLPPETTDTPRKQRENNAKKPRVHITRGNTEGR